MTLSEDIAFNLFYYSYVYGLDTFIMLLTFLFKIRVPRSISSFESVLLIFY